MAEVRTKYRVIVEKEFLMDESEYVKIFGTKTPPGLVQKGEPKVSVEKVKVEQPKPSGRFMSGHKCSDADKKEFCERFEKDDLAWLKSESGLSKKQIKAKYAYFKACLDGTREKWAKEHEMKLKQEEKTPAPSTDDKEVLWKISEAGYITFTTKGKEYLVALYEQSPETAELVAKQFGRDKNWLYSQVYKFRRELKNG